jgi:hypothetical protein
MAWHSMCYISDIMVLAAMQSNVMCSVMAYKHSAADWHSNQQYRLCPVAKGLETVFICTVH